MTLLLYSSGGVFIGSLYGPASNTIIFKSCNEGSLPEKEKDNHLVRIK